MMSDLIKREDAIGACSYETIECYEARKAIRALPSADRPQGKWIFDRHSSKGINRCSECGAKIVGYGENIPFPNCPYCLARMRGANDESTL